MMISLIQVCSVFLIIHFLIYHLFIFCFIFNFLIHFSFFDLIIFIQFVQLLIYFSFLFLLIIFIVRSSHHQISHHKNYYHDHMLYIFSTLLLLPLRAHFHVPFHANFYVHFCMYVHFHIYFHVRIYFCFFFRDGGIVCLGRQRVFRILIDKNVQKNSLFLGQNH